MVMAGQSKARGGELLEWVLRKKVDAKSTDSSLKFKAWVWGKARPEKVRGDTEPNPCQVDGTTTRIRTVSPTPKFHRRQIPLRCLLCLQHWSSLILLHWESGCWSRGTCHDEDRTEHCSKWARAPSLHWSLRTFVCFRHFKRGDLVPMPKRFRPPRGRRF